MKDSCWKPFKDAPKDWTEVLVCNTRQGGVTELLFYNAVHGYWTRKGDPELYPQWTHYMLIPEKPKRSKKDDL